MEGYLDAFNPKESVTPAGIFSSRVEVRDAIKFDHLTLASFVFVCGSFHFEYINTSL